jgi:D-lactate dehydrogenase (cytochrome)
MTQSGLQSLGTVLVEAKYLSDAAHFPGGHAAAIAIPRDTSEIPAIVRDAPAVLVVGAQSSLTGGATPMGEVVLSTEKLDRILEMGTGFIRVEAGVPVATMQEALAQAGAWFPPAPTFTGAFAGGIVATNAAGAATFRHGPVRPWVRALTVILADGTELTIERGATRADSMGIPVPTYRMPDVVKVSAGYYAAPGMDLIDLFIGSEGTLGVITTVTFRTLSPIPTRALAFVPCPSEPDALALVADLRREPGVAAIEHLDRRCLEILREDGADRRCDVRIPEGTSLALLVQMELPAGTGETDAFAHIENSLSDGGDRTVLGRVCRSLQAHGVFDATEMALPGHVRRAEQFVALREAVPAGVNARVGRAQQAIDPRIAKTAADMIVPFERFAEMMEIYRAGFSSRGLDFAVWGHISDGNVHPNVLPQSYADVGRGKEAILFFGGEVARLGGCPLAEHGVGRNAVKQALLRGLYGDAGIEEMRAVKHALDPEGKLAPGVIFPR